MKRAILILTVVLAALAAPLARGAESGLTVLLAGGTEANMISIGLSSDGRDYLIESVVPLEVGGNVCWHPEGQANVLFCSASSIGGFEVNAGAGDDSVVLAFNVPVPVTVRGGPGRDRLVGGAGADKLIGGAGADKLIGRTGADYLYGGPGDDYLIGGGGNDLLHGNSGKDTLSGGSGRNELIP